MASSSAKIGYGAIPDGTLPSLFIEKIKILPTDFEAEVQKVEVTLSVQTTQWPSALISGRYMIFVAFAHSAGPLHKMCAYESWTKDLIRNPKLEGGIVKNYLKVDQSYKNLEGVPINTRSPRRTLYKKEVKLVYECPLKGLKNLFVYATPYAIDPQSISQSGVDRKIKAMKIGAPAVDEIMRNGQSSLLSTVYTLQQAAKGYGKKGEIWAGPVNHYRGSYFASHPNKPWSWSQPHPPLQSRQLSNQKILDLRFLNDVKKLSFSNIPSKIEALSRRQRKDFEKTRKVLNAPAHISDTLYSRTSDNELKIFFSINYDRLARDNTKLGSFIQNKDSLASCFKIENIRVFRTRIDPVNTQPNELTPGKISICGNNIQLSSEKFIGSLKNGVVKPVTFRGANGKVANLVVTDSDMADKSTGTYEYKVYVDLIDTSVSAIARIAKVLPKFLARYNQFLAAADAVGESGFNIKARLKRDQKFLLELQKEWKRLINAYMTAIEFVYGASAYGGFGSLMWRKNLITMVNPGNGDIQSMRMVGELVNNFNTNLQRLFKTTTTPTNGNKFNVSSKITSENSTRRKIMIEHVFASNYTCSAGRDEGTDYLDDARTVNNVGNFTNISFSQYEARVSDELAKFTVPEPNAPGVNKFGFFSPRSLKTGGGIVDTSLKFLPQASGNGVLRGALSPNIRGVARVSPKNTEEVYDEEVGDILGSADVSMVENTKPLIEILADPKPISTKTVRTSNYIFNASFNKDVVSSVAAKEGSQQFKIKRIRSRRSRLRKSRISRRLVSSRAFNFKRFPRPIYGSAGLGSLAAAADNQDPSSTQNNSSFGKSINFNSLVEIQYFDGYVKTGGTINLNAPVWRTLNQTQFNKFKQQKATVLCRMLMVTKAFKVPSHYKLPEYDSLFVLGDQAPEAASINYVGGGYDEIIKSLYKRMKEEMKKTALNIEDPISLVDPAYTQIPSPLNVRLLPPPPPAPARHKPGRQKKSPTRGPRRASGSKVRRSRMSKKGGY